MPEKPLSEDDPRLTTYAIGEMDADEAHEFERLLAESPEARAEVDAIRQLTENLSSEFERELDAVDDGQQPLDSVEEPREETPILLPVKGPSAGADDKIRRPRFWAFGSVAAGIAATFMVVVYVQRHQNPGLFDGAGSEAEIATAESLGDAPAISAPAEESSEARMIATASPDGASPVKAKDAMAASVRPEGGQQQQTAEKSEALAATPGESGLAPAAANLAGRAGDGGDVSGKSDHAEKKPGADSPMPADQTVDEVLVDAPGTVGSGGVAIGSGGVVSASGGSGGGVVSATGVAGNGGAVTVDDNLAKIVVPLQEGERAAAAATVAGPAASSAPSPTPTKASYRGGARDAAPDAAAGEAATPPPAPMTAMFGLVDGESEKGVDKVAEMEGEEDLRRYRGREARSKSPTGRGGERYARLIDNAFKDPLDEELSTFSIDVDTASYAQVRRMLMDDGQWPHPDQVRIEELVNYFDYNYPAPDLAEVEAGEVAPFAVSLEAGAAPWNPKHRLVRIGLKSAELDEDRPPANLVFLLDVSGSMKSADKLALMQQSLRALVPQLGAEDSVTMVAYAGRAGEVLEPTPGDDRDTIMAAIDALSAGGSTNGAGGIKIAYQRAREHFIEDGVNRIILATDGDFNVGVADDEALVRLVEKEAKSGVFLTVLGFGTGNLNDSMMEKITNKGNGNYFYIDRLKEGKKVLVEQMAGTLVTVAKDVKIQVDFNPAKVAAYRLIGYANRMLKREDFDNDKVDAGEIGAGHTVTALYEVVPVGVAVELTGGQDVDGLKYQRRLEEGAEQDLEAKRQKELAERGVTLVESEELLTVKLRYKQPDADESALLEFPLKDQAARARGRRALSEGSDDFRFASAVAAFGMRLRGSRYIDRNFSLEAIAEMAASALGDDKAGRRSELVDMIEQAAGVEPGVADEVGRDVRERLEELR